MLTVIRKNDFVLRTGYTRVINTFCLTGSCESYSFSSLKQPKYHCVFWSYKLYVEIQKQAEDEIK